MGNAEGSIKYKPYKPSIEPKKKKKHINLRFLNDKINVAKIKTGEKIVVPIDYITNDHVEISDLYLALCNNDNLQVLNLECRIFRSTKGYYMGERMAEFYNNKYLQKRLKIYHLENAEFILNKNEKKKIKKYYKKIAGRIWDDLYEYYLMFEKLVFKKIDRMSLKDKTGKMIIEINADYSKTSEDGRYLWEFGNYVIKIKPLSNMILHHLNNETNNTNIKFDKIKINHFSNSKISKGIQFWIFFEI